MVDSSNQAKSIFLEAIEKLAPVQWPAFLDRICAGDPALRAKVERLLAAQAQLGSFHEVPSLGMVAITDQAITERPGTLIGPYKLLEQIGEGGFGVVFMAEQTQPVRRKVAVKLVKPGMDTRQVVARFEAERQTLAIMDHPNIAKIHDGGATPSGRPYFVMELVKGVPITDYCDDSRLTPRARLELFGQVCAAVQHAHQKGIIHRDIKPSNVMVVSHDGTPVVKIIDFGVSKALGQELSDKSLFTGFAQMIGTPLYMSPEQAGQSGLDIDTRSDIYSLGVLLYELLTGTTPFDKEHFREANCDELRRLIREEEPPKPSTRMSTVGQAGSTISAQRQSNPQQLCLLLRGELDWIVMKALDKDRNRRYETASAFAADVERYLNDEAVQACPPSAGYRLRMFFRRYKGPVLAASIVVLALLGGIIGTTLGLIRATDAEAKAVNESGQKAIALAAARHSQSDATDQLFLALLNQARSGRFSRQMGQRLDSLAALEKAARIRSDERLRDEAIAALALPDVRCGLSLHTSPAGTKALALDGLYQSYARVNERGVFSIRTIPENTEIQSITWKAMANVSAVWLSPNGQYLAALDDNHAMQLWRVADRKPLLRDELGPCSNVAFSPNSRQLAIAKDDWVVVIDLASGQETNRWRLPAKAHALAFHPDNSKLAVSYAKNALVSIYDANQGTRIADLPTGMLVNAVLAWHPDGTRLAVGGDPRIQVWNATAKRKLATLDGHVEYVNALSFHPNGNLLASNSWDGTLRLWDSATGRPLMQLPLAAAPQFSSAGQLGCFWQGGEQLQLLEVAPSHEYRTIVSGLGAGQGHYLEGDISPDGRLLALGMSGAGDRVWELSSGRELAVLSSGSHSVLFQADSRELICCSAAGLERWSIQESKEAANKLRLGPPRKMSLPFIPSRAARSPDGKMLAAIGTTAGAGLLALLTTETGQRRMFTHPEGCYVALSSDGRWVASCGWQSDRVRLWDAKTGNMTHEWVLGPMTNAFFTPDSRALVICRGDAFTFWDVETLQPIRRLDRDVALYPGYVAFSPDGLLMALEMAPAVIHLKEVATGRTVAKLEDPHGDRAGWMGFTPDGTQLVVAATYAKAIHVWDLRAIRERLKAIGLDWTWPEFKPANPSVKAAAPLLAKVVPDDSAKPALTPEQEARHAIERCRKDLEKDPNDAATCNELAWIYLTAPTAFRDAEAALPLAEKAMRLGVGNASYRNTLGLAYYRAGRYREAVTILRPNLDKQANRSLAFDLYFLAMSHHQLNETARARDFLALAVRWHTDQRGLKADALEELRKIRAEAEELCGAIGSQPENRATVADP